MRSRHNAVETAGGVRRIHTGWVPASDPISELFVYGTLSPGSERWGLLEEYSTSVEPDSAAGIVFDTDHEYPGAKFDCTLTIRDRIQGTRVSLSSDDLGACFELLDEVEGVGEELFHRIVVTLDSGVQAWTYQLSADPPRANLVASGSWENQAPAQVDLPSGIGLLNFTEARVIGALIEKALATPQNYPLSLNSLVAACNQSSSREPVTDFEEAEVVDVLTQGKDRGLLRFVHPRSGHGVTKYRQVLDEYLELDEASTALLGVLLLRGPQTARELRDRTSRMHDFEGTEDVVATLIDLATRGHVVRLDRLPGQRDERWMQLLT